MGWLAHTLQHVVHSAPFETPNAFLIVYHSIILVQYGTQCRVQLAPLPEALEFFIVKTWAVSGLGGLSWLLASTNTKPSLPAYAQNVEPSFYFCLLVIVILGFH